MIEFDQINWDKLWEEKMKIASGVASWSKNGSERGVSRWDKTNFRPIRVGDNEYIKKLLKKITLRESDSVLDIGCGTGILSIPIARKVKKVTALDVSHQTLEVLKKTALENNIKNIECLQSDWQFIKPTNDIPLHDVVIASRCLGMFDLKDELIKINKMAKKQVYITRIVEEKDIISPKIYELLGRRFRPLPNYYYVYNLLYQLGIQAKIDYVSAELEEKYESIDHAVNVWKWKLSEIKESEELKLREFLESILIYDPGNNNWTTGSFNCRWAIINWTPEDCIADNSMARNNRNNVVTVPDWDKVWHSLVDNTLNHKKSVDSKKWNIFAKHFNQGVLRDWVNKDSYINQLIDKIEINSQETVLDIGCASGGISIPIAKKVQSVTAIDISSEMISYLKENINLTQLDNINSIHGNWEEVVTQSDFPKHDIVVASRCLSGQGLSEKLNKINNIASKRVYFTWIIKISNLQKAVYNILKREFKQEPDYIYVFNLLHSMGVNPTIDFIQCQGRESFTSIEDAVDHYEWILDGITKEEKKTLQYYLEKHYIQKNDGSIISAKNVVSEWGWVVFSWEKIE